MTLKSIMSVILVVLLAGCLKTREQLQGTQTGDSGAMRTDASGSYVGGGNLGTQQRAQIDSRFFEIDRDFRNLYGKIEVLEQKIEENKSSTTTTGDASTTPVKSEEIKALEKRISTLEEALLAIDKKLAKLGDGKTSSATQMIEKPKGPFGYGEMLYAQGKFEEAIQSYDSYRKKYPKGRNYAQATLKMGMCFQKLKMNQDAKAFYKEVIQRYPNTQVSIKAESNLKRL